LLGIYVAYEIFAAIADNVAMRDHGFDQGINAAVSSAAAMSRIMNLDKDQMANAISLALLPNLPLRVVRTGELSHWKGCATSQATSMALWGVRLAKAGMTGPSDPFDGLDGLARLVGPVDLTSLGEPVDGASAVERTLIKFFPSEMSSQGPIGLALKIREQASEPDIEALHVDTYHLAWHEIGGGQNDAEAKWDPKTRETADHSLPYLIAAALVDGGISLDSFTSDRIADPLLRPVMQKITVAADPELERRLRSVPQELVARMRVTLKSGAVLEEEANYPRGHWMNPVTDDELEAKFMGLAPRVLPPAETTRMRELLWQVDVPESFAELIDVYRAWTAPGDPA
jgi:2-methylcitrate dehydratase